MSTIDQSSQEFEEKPVSNWSELYEELQKFLGKNNWVFRGQADDAPLSTTLERACTDLGISQKEIPEIEYQLIRDFRRHYSANDRDLVLNDTLYCMALMQHHGAPTRLIDFTYSPFIAAFFALEKEARPKQKNEAIPDQKDNANIIWCLNTSWCMGKARDIFPALKKRDLDKTRNDTSFIKCYIKRPRYTFIYPDNPLPFNSRLGLQHGVFLCPGDISKTFLKNLKALTGWESDHAILKIRCNMHKEKRLKALENLYHMGINAAILFPGIDGLGRSYLSSRLGVLRRMASSGAGKKLPT
jgi:hypothetical protein